ncbi:hypothetical protein [Actinoallomurus sp. NPDC052274]|uniref:hypothetical protein n=1 Tax=Actinoallomurus sp. NPDC052274 TaxID=3155420 RepID=UPI00342EDDE9
MRNEMRRWALPTVLAVSVMLGLSACAGRNDGHVHPCTTPTPHHSTPLNSTPCYTTPAAHKTPSHKTPSHKAPSLNKVPSHKAPSLHKAAANRSGKRR